MNAFDIVGFIIAVVLTVVGTRMALKKQKRRSKDGYIVKQLEDGGIDTLKAQPLEFWFYSNDLQAIENVENELTSMDFEVLVNQTDEDPCYILFAFKKLVPDIAALQELRVEFERFAKQFGARYDGWGYSGERQMASQD